MKRRTFAIISLLALSRLTLPATAQNTATIKVGDTTGAPLISKHIYGQFAEHLGRSVYDGFYRNGRIRTDVASALKKLSIPNLRWPGGCFADQYHWCDGIGLKTSRPKRINTNWGMVTEDNSFGTSEYLDLCNFIGCEPYVAGNVGTGTPQEMSDWLEYLNFNGSSTLADLRRKNGHPAPYNVSFWGVGNESWGCGGSMSPDYYANLYKHYATFCQEYPGAPKLKLIASGANSEDYNWTEVMMKNVHWSQMYGLSLHYYTLVTGHWPPSGSATSFGENEYFSALKSALKMEEIVEKHAAIMNKYDPKKRVALLVDEWGIWTAPEPNTNPKFLYQQNSLRDALIAGSTLNIFNNHADRVRGANLAQTVNVIHSLILTKGDQMVLTPTYYVFELFKAHQDSKLLPLQIESPDYNYGANSIKAVNGSASVDKTGTTHITLVNLDPKKSNAIRLKLPKGSKVDGRILTGTKFNDFNEFGQPESVNVKSFDQAKINEGQLSAELPPLSVVALTIR